MDRKIISVISQKYGVVKIINLIKISNLNRINRPNFRSIKIDELYDDSVEENTKQDKVTKREKSGRKYSILKLYE